MSFRSVKTRRHDENANPALKAAIDAPGEAGNDENNKISPPPSPERRNRKVLGERNLNVAHEATKEAKGKRVRFLEKSKLAPVIIPESSISNNVVCTTTPRTPRTPNSAGSVGSVLDFYDRTADLELSPTGWNLTINQVDLFHIATLRESIKEQADILQAFLGFYPDEIPFTDYKREELESIFEYTKFTCQTKEEYIEELKRLYKAMCLKVATISQIIATSREA